jgi:HAE1 family hydrophobic/amphiphilic exporter-1
MKKQEQLNGMAISDLSIKQPVFITMIMLLTIVFGLLSFSTMPVNLLPDFEVPIVTVQVSYPGGSPDSVAELVSKPIESTVNTINGIDNITSNSSEGQSFVILEFIEGTDIDQAERSVREKVSAIRGQLPRDVLEPVYQRFDPNAAPIMGIAIATETGKTPQELRRIIVDDIVPQLQRAEGVGSITVTGGATRQINVLMDLEKLQAYQILPSQISRSLQQANANLGLGTINTGAQDISLRAPSMLTKPEDILRIQITGTPYRVSDVATVVDGVADTISYARLNGSDAIILDVLKQSGSNTVSVADNVKSQLERVFTERTDLTYTIPRDSSESVRQSTLSSLEELIFASVAALLVVMLFFSGLRNLLITAALPTAILVIGLGFLPKYIGDINVPIWTLATSIGLLLILTYFRDRNTLVTMAGLPIIMIGTFALMPLFGLTINLITLLALSLAVGLVIDDAIVVRENIYRRTQRGDSPRVAASRGTAEVALSVLAMTFTIVAVFVPVTFTSGTTGIIFQSFGITIAVAIMLSLFEAFMFAPMLSATLFKKQKVQPHAHDAAHSHGGEIRGALAELRSKPANEIDQNLLHEAEEDPGKLGRFYEKMLGWSLRSVWRRVMVVGVAVLVLVASFQVAAGLRFSFFPPQDPHLFLAGFELPPGTALAQTEAQARRAEQILLNDPDVEFVITTAGFRGNPERAEFFVKLKGRTPTNPTQDRLRPQLNFLPNLAFSAPSFQGASTGVGGRTLQLSLQTTQPISALEPIVPLAIATMQNVPGLVDIDTNYRPGKPELRFRADPARIGALGVTNDDIASSVRAMINGDRATVLREGSTDTDIVVRLRGDDRSSPDALRNIIVPTRSGSVPLSSLGQIEVSSSPTVIRRFNRLNQVLIGANLAPGVNLGVAQAEFNQKLQELNLPETVITSFVGQAQQQTEGFGSLLLAMGLSVLFVYMVLASQFGSFTQPLVIMVAMPFSFIGAFIGLRIAGFDLDITGMIGLILLLGLVVKNSILLVDFTNRLRGAGLSKHAALELAGAIRLRPILMTTISLVAGAIPVALGIHVVGTGEGSEFRKGLAVVLIGGLTTSMFLTLLVVPTAYSLMESVTERLGRLFRSKDDDADEDEGSEGKPLPTPVATPQPALATAGASSATPIARVTPSSGNGANGHHEKPAVTGSNEPINSPPIEPKIARSETGD